MNPSTRTLLLSCRARVGTVGRRPKAVRLAIEALEDRAVPSTFTVTTGLNDGPGSLRQAILDSNVTTGPDTIAFDVGGGGVQTIAPTAPLPDVTDPVVIDGTTQPGFAGSPVIVLNGSQAGIGTTALTISAGDSTVRGLVINSFPYADGIRLTINGGNRIVGNYIGTDVSGTITSDFHIGQSGVIVLSGTDNVIGGTTAADRNVISAYPFRGIALADGGNTVQGNFIGTNATGTSRLVPGSAFQGVGISVGQVSDNQIGGTTPGAGNLISGTAGAISFTGSGGQRVQGNLIGTDVSGTVALGNGSGISMGSGAGNNLVGGPEPSARNVIAASTQQGVYAREFNNRIEGNYIGTDITGTQALGNGLGVEFGGPGNALIDNLISGNLTYGAIVGGINSVARGNFIGTDVTGTVALPNDIGVFSGGGVLGGTAPGDGNLISGNTTAGIRMGGGVIQGNRIGTDVTGSRALGNGVGLFFPSLVTLQGGTIGGPATGAGNLISGNLGDGITGRTAGVVVQGNLIGTDATGAAALGNGGNGIAFPYAENAVIGGPDAARNIISGNALNGIFLANTSSFVQVQGNYIGTNAAGTAAVPNGGHGIHVDSTLGHPSNVIGGTTSGVRNVISGNGQDGVRLDGSAAGLFQLQGNYIGTDAGGTLPVPNGGSGVVVNGGSGQQVGGLGVQVGGAAVGAGNLISGNMGDGVVVAASGIRVEGNRIGTDAGGAGAVGNGRAGVTVTGSNAVVGGPAPGAGNQIAWNVGAGVEVTDGSGNRVQGNAIHSNGGQGIDLGGNGVTPNDPGDADEGPNGLQNFPVIMRARPGAPVRVSGTFSGAAATTFTLDFYAGPAADPTGFGEGDRYLGSATVTTDAAGEAEVEFTPAGPATPGEVVTATATDSTGNTSEFSAAVMLIYQADIDIEPADPANGFDLNSAGLLPVAILSTPEFDAATVDTSDLSAIRFGDPTGPDRVSPVAETLGDADGDGDVDRVLTFSIPAVRQSGALTAASTQAVLTGLTFAGIPWTGTDAVAVSLVNQAPAVTTNTGLIVNQGATVLATPAALGAADPEGDPITYTLTTGPAHGVVRVGHHPVTSFTQADLDAGLVDYAHDGTRATGDSFVVTVGDGALNSDPVTISVTVHTDPVVTLHPVPRSGFAGTIVTFAATADGSPTPTVQWQVSTDGGLSFADVAGATGPTLTVRAPLSLGDPLYRAVFTNPAGVAMTAAAALTVSLGLVIRSDPIPQSASVGTTVTFMAAATGTSKPKVQWQVSTDEGATFANIPGALGPKLRVQALATADGNLYRAVFTNAAGSAATLGAGLTVSYGVTVAGMRRVLAVPVGADVSLTGSVRGLTTPTVQWEESADKGKTYTVIPGATAATLTFTATAGDTGRYFRAVFTEGTRVRRTGPVVLIVGDPPAVITPPANLTVEAGGTATFSVAVTGTPTVKVQWQVSTDGGRTYSNVRGAVKTTLTLKNVKPILNSNLYRVVLTSPFDQVESSAAKLTVT